MELMKNISLLQHQKFGQNMLICFLIGLVLCACTPQSTATSFQSSSCTTLSPHSTSQNTDASVLANIPLSGHPFKAVATNDGQWIFVSVDANSAASSGVAVLHQQGGQMCLQRIIPLSSMPFGMTLTHDNHILIVADYSNVAFIDVPQAEHMTHGAILGYVPEQHFSSR